MRKSLSARAFLRGRQRVGGTTHTHRERESEREREREREGGREVAIDSR